MIKTIPLYDENPYETSFEATVLDCTLDEATNSYKVVLDQTQFFPEQGGQTPDKGTLAGQQVLDVQIAEGVISHYLNQPLTINQKVEGNVDWNYRFSNMQQHTGEHIFSGLVHSHYGYENVGFHLSDNIVTMDYNGPLNQDQVTALELEANRCIWANIPVLATFPAPEELAVIQYRSKKELEGDIRIVTIGDIDSCACCAPHVSTTAQVGILKVMSIQNYKGGVRLSILCGERALDAFVEQQQVISRLTNLFSLPQAELSTAAERLQAEKENLRQENTNYQRQLLLQKLNQDKIYFEIDLDPTVQREGVNYLVENNSGVCGIFSQTQEEKEEYRFIIASSDTDCRPIAAELRQSFGAKGGGSAQMIQGYKAAEQSKIKESININL